MTTLQIERKLNKAGIEMSSLEISRDRVDVWADDYNKSKRLARKVAKTLGWSNVGTNGSYAWTSKSASCIDWNNCL